MVDKTECWKKGYEAGLHAIVDMILKELEEIKRLEERSVKEGCTKKTIYDKNKSRL